MIYDSNPILDTYKLFAKSEYKFDNQAIFNHPNKVYFIGNAFYYLRYSRGDIRAFTFYERDSAFWHHALGAQPEMKYDAFIPQLPSTELLELLMKICQDESSQKDDEFYFLKYFARIPPDIVKALEIIKENLKLFDNIVCYSNAHNKWKFLKKELWGECFGNVPLPDSREFTSCIHIWKKVLRKIGINYNVQERIQQCMAFSEIENYMADYINNDDNFYPDEKENEICKMRKKLKMCFWNGDRYRTSIGFLEEKKMMEYYLLNFPSFMKLHLEKYFSLEQDHYLYKRFCDILYKITDGNIEKTDRIAKTFAKIALGREILESITSLSENKTRYHYLLLLKTSNPKFIERFLLDIFRNDWRRNIDTTENPHFNIKLQHRFTTAVRCRCNGQALYLSDFGDKVNENSYVSAKSWNELCNSKFILHAIMEKLEGNLLNINQEKGKSTDEEFIKKLLKNSVVVEDGEFGTLNYTSNCHYINIIDNRKLLEDYHGAFKNLADIIVINDEALTGQYIPLDVNEVFWVQMIFFRHGVKLLMDEFMNDMGESEDKKQYLFKSKQERVEIPSLEKMIKDFFKKCCKVGNSADKAYQIHGYELCDGFRKYYHAKLHCNVQVELEEFNRVFKSILSERKIADYEYKGFRKNDSGMITGIEERQTNTKGYKGITIDQEKYLQEIENQKDNEIAEKIRYAKYVQYFQQIHLNCMYEDDKDSDAWKNLQQYANRLFLIHRHHMPFDPQLMDTILTMYIPQISIKEKFKEAENLSLCADFDKAWSLLKDLVQKGCTRAMYLSSYYDKLDEMDKMLMLEKGFELEDDLCSLRYLRLKAQEDRFLHNLLTRVGTAAESGDKFSQYELGICYYYGYGVEQDNKKALAWFRAAARDNEQLMQDMYESVLSEIEQR
jgi:hypothetical protein